MPISGVECDADAERLIQLYTLTATDEMSAGRAPLLLMTMVFIDFHNHTEAIPSFENLILKNKTTKKQSVDYRRRKTNNYSWMTN